jgi:hypothetical protein
MANTEYIKTRRKTGARNECGRSVDASSSREYLNVLSEMGIGRASVHKVCGVNERSLWEIAANRKARIQRSTEDRILSIKPNDAISGGAFVDAYTARRQIKALLAKGFTKSELAERLKRFEDRLRILEGDKVRASSALRINRLYRLLMDEGERNEFMYDAA